MMMNFVFYFIERDYWVGVFTFFFFPFVSFVPSKS